VECHRQARKEDGKLEQWEALLEMIAVKETKAKPYRSLPLSRNCIDGNNDECLISLRTVALAMEVRKH
jgi:hypothetical protein